MSAPAAISWGRAIAWGAYLACSWTWCIGMFLPLLLVRDFGQAGWWAFAVPNVVGAAAMGWVLRSSRAASALRAAHLDLARAFSLVTIAFHAYFLAWMTGGLIPLPLMGGVILATLFIAAMVLALRDRSSWLALACWFASALVLVIILLQVPGAVAGSLARPAVLPATDILWMSPVCALGFGLCPYLDLTFVRVRRLCDGATGAVAFTIGFGIMFASMIVLTLAYGSMFAPPIAGLEFAARPAWARLATIHIGLQAAFTIAVHVVELATPEPAGGIGAAHAQRHHTLSAGDALAPVDLATTDASAALAPRLGRTWLLLVVLLAAGLGTAGKLLPDLAGLTAGEIGYRTFMAAYGLVFPAYVWVCVLPRRAAISRRAARTAWLTGVLIAMPFFAAGFLWRQTIWLGPGLLIVMSSRWWVRKPTL